MNISNDEITARTLTVRSDELNSALEKIYYLISTLGVESAPRGQRVLEWPAPVLIELSEHKQPWTLLPGRKINPYFAIAEVLWILAGRNDVDFISYYNSNISSFSNNGKTFDAAYGERIRNWPSGIDQISYVVEKLSLDNNSRQAVIALWNPVLDTVPGSKDYPCNNLCYFTLRNNKLNMSVVRRSNDMVWGLPYNQIQFWFIHAIIAGTLNVEMGEYCEFVQNMHVYLDNYKGTLEIIKQRFNQTAGFKCFTETTSCWLEPPERRITISQFNDFAREFFEFEKECRTNGVKLRALAKVKESLTEQGVPEYWVKTMLAIPVAYIAKKHKDKELHDYIVTDVEEPVKWLINDFNRKITNE